jgi:DNA helicase-2/ATP-dependent DNA helicase PcrA
MQFYKIEGNRRSTTQIIEVINKIRNDAFFMQSSVFLRKGEKPIIFVGTYKKTRKEIKIFLESDNLTVLARKNEDLLVLCSADGLADKIGKNLEDNFYNDSTRGMLIKYIIESFSYCQVLAFNDAIHSMKKAFRKDCFFDPDRDPIIKIKQLLEKLPEYEDLTITDFCNKYLFVKGGFISKITKGRASEIYSKWTVKEAICLNNRISDTLMQPRTIHSVKGDEFDNVLLVFPSSSFDEDKDLGFLISPNMEEEENRIRYVALSRARKRLFINVPSLSKEYRAIASELFKIVDLVDE